MRHIECRNVAWVRDRSQAFFKVSFARIPWIYKDIAFAMPYIGNRHAGAFSRCPI
jgi:hypothetical protein